MSERASELASADATTNLEPGEAVDGVGPEAPLRLVVSLVPARPEPVDGEPRAPAVEGRVGQGGGGELDAPKLVPILRSYWKVERGRKPQISLHFIAMESMFACVRVR